MGGAGGGDWLGWTVDTLGWTRLRARVRQNFGDTVYAVKSLRQLMTSDDLAVSECRCRCFHVVDSSHGSLQYVYSITLYCVYILLSGAYSRGRRALSRPPLEVIKNVLIFNVKNMLNFEHANLMVDVNVNVHLKYTSAPPPFHFINTPQSVIFSGVFRHLKREYISGIIHFQKCSKFSIIFFALNFSTIIFSLPKAGDRRKDP